MTQIAKLCRYYPLGGTEALYCAVDPMDDEMLTQWYETILDVEDELRHLDTSRVRWGLNTAAYAGESDVPTRPRDEDTGEPERYGSLAVGPTIPCYGL